VGGGPAGPAASWQELNPDGPDRFAWEGLTITSAPVNHIPGSLAYRVEAGGRALVYSGDTDVSDSLVELARGADLLILECANPFKTPGHLTPGEAGALAARAQVPRLLLSHFYPPCDEVDVTALAATEFAGEILRAEDDLRVVFGLGMKPCFLQPNILIFLERFCLIDAF
jgi:ribonuclease BN (tRNA processing enzyme)